MTPLRRRVWTRHPPTPRQIDRSHWFYGGSRLIYPFWTLENQGQAESSAGFTGSAFLSADEYGPHLRLPNNNSALSVFGAAAGTVQEFTVVCAVSLDSAALDYTTLLMTGAGSVQLRVSNAGKLELLRAEIALLYTSSYVFSRNRPTVIAVSYRGSDGRVLCAIDGHYDGTATNAVTFNAFSTFLIGTRGSGVESFAHKQYLFGWHPKAFERSELVAISANPWAMWRRQLVLYPGQATVGGNVRLIGGLTHGSLIRGGRLAA